MDFPLGIQAFHLQEEYDKNNWAWTNKHENFTVPIPKNSCMELIVRGEAFEAKYPRDFPDKYVATTKNIQWLIERALKSNTRFRPMGSGWSLSKVMVTEGGIINTKKLNLVTRLGPRMVAPEYLAAGGKAEHLVFSQCGTQVADMNEFLEARGLSLRASGGSNGQTIIGALSTGTHGAAFKFGGLIEFVRGLHIVTGPDRHVWLEPKSRPATTEAFRKEALGISESIIDDDLFYSALVSFGSFGFIHGVLIEVEPKFLLEQELKIVPYDAAMEKAITQYDFSGLLKYLDPKNVPHFNDTVYHFELAINPHTFKKNGTPEERTMYLRLMYKIPYRSDYPRDDGRKKDYTYGDDLPGLVAKALGSIGNVSGAALNLLIPKMVNGLFKTAYDRPPSAVGTVGETFKNSIFKGRIFSAGFSFDRADVPRLIDIILDMNRKKPFAGVMAMRFIKGSKATLGWTYFDNTCVLEMDGVDADVNHEFLAGLAVAIEANKIPFGVHWGKINTFLNASHVQYMYGTKITKWKQHRSRLMKPEVQKVFNNWFLQNCGLDTPEAPLT